MRYPALLLSVFLAALLFAGNASAAAITKILDVTVTQTNSGAWGGTWNDAGSVTFNEPAVLPSAGTYSYVTVSSFSLTLNGVTWDCTNSPVQYCGSSAVKARFDENGFAGIRANRYYDGNAERLTIKYGGGGQLRIGTSLHELSWTGTDPAPPIPPSGGGGGGGAHAPEPSAALLFGVGALVVRGALRRSVA